MYDKTDPDRGAALRRRREALARSQRTIAESTGLSLSTVKRAEAGDPLRAETASALCAVLGIAEGTFVPPRWGVETPPESEGVGAAATPRVEERGVDPATSTEVTAAARATRWPFLFRKGMSRPTTFTWVMTTLAVTVEALAWVPWERRLDVFFVMQKLAQLIVCGIALEMSLTEAMAHWRSCERWSALGKVAVGLALPCWVFATFLTSADVTSREYREMLVRASRWEAVIEARSAMEPGWDADTSRWAVRRWVARRQGQVDPSLDTPGTMKARATVVDECRRLFVEAPRYDHDRCDENWGTAYGDGVSIGRVLFASLYGASFLPVLEPDPFRAEADPERLFADPRFRRASTLVEGLPAREGIPDRAALRDATEALRLHGGEEARPKG